MNTKSVLILIVFCFIQFVWFLPVSIVRPELSTTELLEEDLASKSPRNKKPESKGKLVDTSKSKNNKQKCKLKKLPVKVEYVDSDSDDDKEGHAYVVKTSNDSKECKVPLNITFCQCDIPDGCDYADGHKSGCNCKECSCNCCHKPCCCNHCHKTCCCSPHSSCNCVPSSQITPNQCVASVCCCPQNIFLEDCLCDHGCMFIQPMDGASQQFISYPCCIQQKQYFPQVHQELFPCCVCSQKQKNQLCHYSTNNVVPIQCPCLYPSDSSHEHRHPEPTSPTFPTPRPFGWKPKNKCDCQQGCDCEPVCHTCCEPCCRDEIPTAPTLNQTETALSNITLSNATFSNSPIENVSADLPNGFNKSQSFPQEIDPIVMCCCYLCHENDEQFDSTLKTTNSSTFRATTAYETTPIETGVTSLLANKTSQVLKNPDEPTFVVGK